jgi:hypothetical protein
MKHLNKYVSSWRLGILAFVSIFSAQWLLPVLVPSATAGTLTYGEVRLNRLNASQATTGTVCAKTNAAVQTEDSIAVTFPTAFSLSTTAANWAVNTTSTGWPKDPVNDTTTATAWPGITAPSNANQINNTSKTVEFTGSNLTASTWYCFNWTTASGSTVTTGTAGNDQTGVITTCSDATNCAGVGSGATSSGNLDTSNWATSIVANNCGSGSQACDQIYVTASVNASFTFSLSSNTAALSTLSTSNPIASSAINATVSTNAQRGFNIWAADPAGTPGLTSANAAKTIAYSPGVGSAASALSNGVEGFNLGASTVSGTCNGSQTYDAAFDNTANTSYKGGGLDNTMRNVVASNGTANACALPLKVNASISATTPAATDYAATIQVVAAGRF